MKVVRVNKSISRMVTIGAIILPIIILFGILIREWTIVAISFFIFIGFLYNYLVNRTYELILNKGTIFEKTLISKRTIEFNSLRELDCQIKDTYRSRSWFPVFRIESQKKEHIFVLTESADLREICDWVMENYPEAKISAKVQKLIKSSNWTGFVQYPK